jgi:hypothetical protein
MITCNRVNRQGGGIALYIRDNLNFKIIDTLGINDDNICQSLFVEIDLNNSNVIVGVIYRPPHANIELFNNYIDTTLATLNRSNKPLYIVGEFNINLLKLDSSDVSKDFFETMISYSLCPTIFKPTRITCHTASLIDNCFTNSFEDTSSSGILSSHRHF